MREFPSNGAKLQDYEAFLAIVDTGNLTQAAARLRRSLQSVSRSLSALEAQVGAVLIRRTTRVAEIVLDDFTLAPTTAHAIWPSGSRTPSRVRRFVDLLVQRLKKEVS